MGGSVNHAYWTVGDRVRGAGTPVPGEPYVIPTADAEGRICDMEIGDILMTGPRHYTGVVKSITPVEDQTAWDIWGASV